MPCIGQEQAYENGKLSEYLQELETQKIKDYNNNLIKKELNSELNELIIKLNKASDTIRYNEACLCAIITEAKKMGIDKELVDKASLNGQVNIHKFVVNHFDSDEARIKYQLSKYSEHERELMRTILK